MACPEYLPQGKAVGWRVVVEPSDSFRAGRVARRSRVPQVGGVIGFLLGLGGYALGCAAP